MTESEHAPKAWAQQLANHLVECLKPELVLCVQQGVREELQSFFSREDAGKVAVQMPSSADDQGNIAVQMPSSVNLAISGSNGIDQVLQQPLEEPTQALDPAQALGPAELTVNLPASVMPELDPDDALPKPVRKWSCPDAVDCSKIRGIESWLQTDACNDVKKSQTPAEEPDDDQLIGKEDDNVVPPRTCSDVVLAANAAAAVAAATGSRGSPSTRATRRAQTASFEPRFRGADSQNETAEEEGTAALLIRRHYRAFSTAKEIRQIEKAKQAEMLRTMSGSSSQIFSSEPSSSCTMQDAFKERDSLKRYPGFARCVVRFVRHTAFDSTIGIFIVLNAIAIGVQTDWIARNIDKSEQLPLTFTVVEWCFATVFFLELLARMCVYGRVFFTMSGRNWNIFDCLVVGLQLVEQSLLLIEIGSGSYNLSAFRMLRFLQLVRVMRLARIMRLIGELRTIVVSIMSSMRSLGWTVCLLLLMIYMVGVYLTQLVSDWRIWWVEKEMAVDSRELEYYYGSVSRSVLSLYQSISGGLSWDVACSPLIDQISPAAGILFALYIAFSVLAIMNVVTGVFVESALVTARDDKDVVMLNNVREVFQMSDENGDGKISWQEFKQQLDKKEMQELFQSIGIDLKEARALFQLLDLDETGEISLSDFYDGCVRMKGDAKAIDLVTVMYESRMTSRKLFRHCKEIELRLKGVFDFLGENNSVAFGKQISSASQVSKGK